MHQMWILQYRPRTLDQYVWVDPAMRNIVEGWLAQQALPHCLFSGHHGCGKTSLALLLLDLLEIPPEDRLILNASRDRGVEVLEEKIGEFIDAWAFNRTGLKYIYLDEADRISPTAQGMLRADMENFPNCRFVMTCNEPRKIIPPLHSRMQELRFPKLDQTEFTMRAADILGHENISYEPELLCEYVTRLYPDLRKMIGTLQQNSRDGVLLPITDEVESTHDFLLEVVSLFKANKFLAGRRLLIEKADPEGYLDIFRYFYRNLDLFGSTQPQQDKALLAVRDAMLQHDMASDKEINMAALIAELSLIHDESI